jgi:hypothetical protein
MPRSGPSRAQIKDWSERFANGESRTDIAADYGVSRATVFRYTREVMSGKKRKKLGDGLIRWSKDNANAVERIRRLAYASDYEAHDKTCIILAAADAARSDLRSQTGNISPTIRAVLYYMMGNYGASKDIYQSLIIATAEMRKRGIWRRNYFTDASPDATKAPGDHTITDALRGSFAALPRPDDAFINAPFVLGVAVEARGGQRPLAGALRQRLGFDVPVFACSGMSAIPRTFNMENQMRAWAKQSEVPPIMLVITDYDPSGQVIANNLVEWLDDINVIHIGITPPLAEEHNAFDASELEDDEEKSDSTHRRSEIWTDAIERYGKTEYQVEALDYATWADIIAGHLERLLDQAQEAGDEAADATLNEMRATLKLHQHPFKTGDSLMAALYQVAIDHEGDPQAIAKQLGLELKPVKPTLAGLRKRRS